MELSEWYFTGSVCRRWIWGANEGQKPMVSGLGHRNLVQVSKKRILESVEVF